MSEFNFLANCISTQCPKYKNCKRAKSERKDNVRYWYYCEHNFRFYSPIIVEAENGIEESKASDNNQEGLEYEEGEDGGSRSSRIDGSTS